jgi:phosphopantetheine--protein transferase-like protein
VAVGIDIVYIPRLIGKENFAKRVLSEEEYKEYLARNKCPNFLAGRFASKEAFIKAQDFIEGNVPLSSIEVVVTSSDKPKIKFRNKLYDLSIAHDKDYAIAIVNIEEE